MSFSAITMEGSNIMRKKKSICFTKSKVSVIFPYGFSYTGVELAKLDRVFEEQDFSLPSCWRDTETSPKLKENK